MAQCTEEEVARRRAYSSKYRAAHLETRRRQAREWAKKHTLQAKEYSVQWAKENATRRRIQIAAWASANRARKNATNNAWLRANPEIVRICAHNRRARVKSVGGQLSQGLGTKLMAVQGGQCFYCSIDLLETGYHFDHYMPIALGGSNEDSNIRLACPGCNLKKKAKHPEEFLREIAGGVI